jgi:hypothetical protein
MALGLGLGLASGPAGRAPARAHHARRPPLRPPSRLPSPPPAQAKAKAEAEAQAKKAADEKAALEAAELELKKEKLRQMGQEGMIKQAEQQGQGGVQALQARAQGQGDAQVTEMVGQQKVRGGPGARAQRAALPRRAHCLPALAPVWLLRCPRLLTRGCPAAARRAGGQPGAVCARGHPGGPGGGGAAAGGAPQVRQGPAAQVRGVGAGVQGRWGLGAGGSGGRPRASCGQPCRRLALGWPLAGGAAAACCCQRRTTLHAAAARRPLTRRAPRRAAARRRCYRLQGLHLDQVKACLADAKEGREYTVPPAASPPPPKVRARARACVRQQPALGAQPLSRPRNASPLLTPRLPCAPVQVEAPSLSEEELQALAAKKRAAGGEDGSAGGAPADEELQPTRRRRLLAAAHTWPAITVWVLLAVGLGLSVPRFVRRRRARSGLRSE